MLLISLIAGAMTQEFFWWYNIRHKLNLKRYKNLMRSRGYWIATFSMIAFTTVAIMVWKLDRLDNYSVFDFFFFGAALPILIKELVGLSGKKERKIGAYSSSSINSYFLTEIHE